MSMAVMVAVSLIMIVLVLLLLLELVFRNAPENRTTDRAQESVVGLVARITAGKTARYSTSNATLAFLGAAGGTLLLIVLSRLTILLLLLMLAIVGIMLRLSTIILLSILILLAVSLLWGIALLLRVALLWWVALLGRITLLGWVALVVALVVLIVRAGHCRETSLNIDVDVRVDGFEF